MKLFKKWMIGVLMVVLVFTVAACGSSNNGESSGTDAENTEEVPVEKETVTIEYWHTYSDQEEKVLVEQIKPLFEEQNPGIELKITRMPYEGLEQQVIAGVAGEATPDLMRMDIIWVPKFAKLGALTDVSTLDGFNEIKANVFEGPLATNYYDGGYYGVPVNTNTKIAIFNKKLMGEVGLTEAPKTIKELEDAVRKLVAKGKPGGIGMGGANAWGFLPYFWSLGGKLTNDDYSKVEGFLNSAESVKALEHMVSWQTDGLFTPNVLGGEPSTWDGMKNNDYLMIDDGPWFYSILMNDTESAFKPLDETVRALIPAGDAGSHSVIGGEDLVVFKNAKHPKEAWTFAKWMMGEEPQKLMSATGLIPANMKAARDPKFLEVPFVKEYVEQLKTALPRTPIPQWGDMEGIVNLAFEKALRGEAKPKEALDEAAQQVEVILKQ